MFFSQGNCQLHFFLTKSLSGPLSRKFANKNVVKGNYQVNLPQKNVLWQLSSQLCDQQISSRQLSIQLFEEEKSCIRETPNLSTDADSSTNIFFPAGIKKGLIAYFFFAILFFLFFLPPLPFPHGSRYQASPQSLGSAGSFL